MNRALLSCMFALLLTLGLQQAHSQTILTDSVVNGTGTGFANAFDDDYLTSFEISPTGGAGTRVSFIVDLGEVQPVTGVAMYGNVTYLAAQQMFSDEIIVEGSVEVNGTYDVMGSINVGNTRPTDPDPAIGGVNPWTGGNGRLIPCTPGNARYLRISGDQAFDNFIRITDIQINPEIVIHALDPINQGVAFNPFDVGGGDKNSRVSVDMVDGLLDTRTFMGTAVSLTLDIGSAQSVGEFRLLTSELDAFAIPEEGNVYVSSTDDPTNMDTLETNFDGTGPLGQNNAVTSIVLPNRPTKRFYRLDLLSTRDEAVPNGTANTFRVGEILYKLAEDLPVPGISVIGGSVVGGTAGAGNESEASATDEDYNTYFQINGTASTASFVVDLGGSVEVSSVALYGKWEYLANQLMFSDDVVVEAGNSASGPWTQIGSLNVGNTRPTDPDPTVGGVNPWTGGNGRRIVCTPTDATHLRISGGFGFDNPVRIHQVLVNPGIVSHTVTPVDQGQTLWDIGGGAFNTRTGHELVDGNIKTRANPKLAFAMTLDLGNEPRRVKALRIFPWESDLSLLPSTGVIRVSSTDDPANMDTVVTNYNVAYIGGGIKQIDLPSVVNKRYLQIEFDQTGIRMGQIEIVEAEPDYLVVPVELSTFELN